MNAIFLIDGFNLYHSLTPQPLVHYKWLNLRSLAEKFTPRTELIKDIFYFTALTPWSPEKMKRHRVFIKAQEYFGIQVVYGEFRKRTKICQNCKTIYSTFEEKQTDVNIAITLFRLAIENKFEKAYILSGDSDLIPSVKAVKKLFPTKLIGVIIPIGRNAEELKNICDFHMKIKEKHLVSSLLPNPLVIDPSMILKCPDAWK